MLLVTGPVDLSVPSFFLDFETPLRLDDKSRASTISDGRDLLRSCCNKIIQSLTDMRQNQRRD